LRLELKDGHFYLLQHHYYHQDSDGNAGQVALEKGFVRSAETGRRASRTLREAYKLTEYKNDPQTKKPAVVQGRLSQRLGQRNFLTEAGLELLKDRNETEQS
jgi:hypothetical protein